VAQALLIVVSVTLRRNNGYEMPFAANPVLQCVTKSWVPKYMLANPLGSKTPTSLSSHMLVLGHGLESMGFKELDLLLGVIEI